MSMIRILPEHVANQIAAGEVVERPASIVKELLENSLDAGAKRIDVYVESGGKRLVRVVDDGCGMNRDDALLAFERHATSKIRDAEDLFEISTLGFRGEALPSIAAVSRLVLETRELSETSGTRIEIAGGRLRDVKDVAWAGGTSVEVRDVFFNTPARRKFLRSESTELSHIASLVTHYALAHPETNMRLTSLANEMINAPPAPDLRSRVYQLMGGQLLEQLIEMAPVERQMPPASGGEDAAPPAGTPARARVLGFVSRPEVQKLNRHEVYFFVNRRLVRDRLILHAITEAYRNILPPKMFPVALVFLELPPAEVDVNVHPSKTEVRFRHPNFIHDVVRDAIRQALIAARPVVAFPMPRSAEAAVSAGQGDVPRGPDDLSRRAGGDSPGAPGAAGAFRLSPPRPQPYVPRLPLAERAEMTDPFTALSRGAQPSEALAAGVAAPSEAPGALSQAAPEFPADLHPLGQLEASFIIATNADGLWIIDQHVAHERILFEKQLRLAREQRAESQRLLIPIIVELQPEQQALFAEIAAELRASGFDAEPFGQRAVVVRTAPADIGADQVESLLLAIFDAIRGGAESISLETLRSQISATIACHAAIKVHTPLDREKMNWLVRELSRTECPMTCPHGRPILLKHSLKEIQKAFKRL